MKNLIEALKILLKYGDNPFPTHCEHDVMYLYGAVTPDEVTAEDRAQLEELSFRVDEELNCFYSYLYGSC